MTTTAELPVDAIQHHLETMFGAGATFRDGQREAIDAVVRDGSRTLVVERTGWGKSLVYWIATRVRRDPVTGPRSSSAPCCHSCGTRSRPRTGSACAP